MCATLLAHCGFGYGFGCLLLKCTLSPPFGYKYAPRSDGRQPKTLPCVIRTGAFLFVPHSPSPSPQWAMARGGAAPTDIYGFVIRHSVFFGLGGVVPCGYFYVSTSPFLLVLLSCFHYLTELRVFIAVYWSSIFLASGTAFRFAPCPAIRLIFVCSRLCLQCISASALVGTRRLYSTISRLLPHYLLPTLPSVFSCPSCFDLSDLFDYFLKERKKAAKIAQARQRSRLARFAKPNAWPTHMRLRSSLF